MWKIYHRGKKRPRFPQGLKTHCICLIRKPEVKTMWWESCRYQTFPSGILGNRQWLWQLCLPLWKQQYRKEQQGNKMTWILHGNERKWKGIGKQTSWFSEFVIIWKAFLHRRGDLIPLIIWSQPFDHLLMLLWTHSNISMSLYSCPQSCMYCSRRVSREQRRRITSLDSVTSLPFIQSKIWMVF